MGVPAYDHCAGGQHSVKVDVDKLWKLRVNQGLTQRELARKARISNSTLSKIEHGGGAMPRPSRSLPTCWASSPSTCCCAGSHALGVEAKRFFA